MEWRWYVKLSEESVHSDACFNKNIETWCKIKLSTRGGDVTPHLKVLDMDITTTTHDHTLLEQCNDDYRYPDKMWEYEIFVWM